MFTIAGRPELIADPRFATLASRVANTNALYATLAKIIATRTTAEWQRLLEEANVPVMPVRTKEALLEDEQLAASGFWRMHDHPTEGRLQPAPEVKPVPMPADPLQRVAVLDPPHASAPGRAKCRSARRGWLLAAGD